MKKSVLKENALGMLIPYDIEVDDEEALVTLEDIVLEITTSSDKVLKKDIYDKYVIDPDDDKKMLNEAVKEMGWESYTSNGKSYWRKKEG